MRKLLLAGGSYSDIPLIKCAKKKGYYVITSGNNPNDLGHLYSDEKYLVDFSDRDKLLKLAIKLDIDYIVPSSHDLSLVSSSYVAEKLKLPGYDSYETTKLLHHKDLFRKMALKIGLSSPTVWTLSSITDEFNYEIYDKFPLIIKPIDLGGGKGITKVSTITELKDGIKTAFLYSKAKRVVIEKFMDGSLHSFSSYIQDKKAIFYYGDNEFSFMNPYGVSTSTSPSDNLNKVKKQLLSELEKLIIALDLNDGILHLQYLYDGNNITIVEFTRRMPGDWYSKVVELSTNINYTEMVLNGFCGIKNKVPQTFEQKGYYSRHCLMSKNKGLIVNLKISPLIKKLIIDKLFWYKNKDLVEDEINQKFGLFIIKYNSLDEMQSMNLNINDYISLEVK